MKHLQPYLNNDYNVSLVNSITEPISELIDKRLSFESLIEEANFLNKIEESIPEDIKLMIELDMILEKGGVETYLKNLMTGDNRLIKMASKHLSEKDARKLNESYKIAMNSFRTTVLNEQDVSTAINRGAKDMGTGLNQFDDVMSNTFGNKKDIPSTAFTSTLKSAEDATVDNQPINIDAEIDKIASDDIHKTGGESLMAKLKEFGMAITEGGSAWGILHLVLDIVGIVGDFFSPIGLITDIINGILYMLRGKWVLAILSFAAAVIPFAGPVIKNVFRAGKAGKAIPVFEKAFGATIKGSSNISQAALKEAAKSAPETIEGLNYIAKFNKSSLSKVGTALNAFFEKFLGKIVEWIPFVGKPLRQLFIKIGDLFNTFSIKATKVSDDILKGMGKAELDVANDFLSAANKPGAKIVSKGNEMIVLTKNGQVLSKMPSHLLGGIGNIKAVGKAQNSYMTAFVKKAGAKNVEQTNRAIAKFYTNLTNVVEANAKLGNSVNKIGKMAYRVRSTTAYFIGKQIVKYLQSDEGLGKKVTNPETEAIGNLAVRNMFHDKINKELAENPDQIYSVPYIDTFSSNEELDTLNTYLNYMAKKTGYPSIGSFTDYVIRESDEKDPDAIEFTNEMYPENKDKKGMVDREDIKESKSHLKHIRDISDFL
jgi:hypothetical protein